MRRPVTAAVLFVPVLLLSGCLAISGRTTTTVPEVEREIDQALPGGSSRQEIETWLAGRNLDFVFSDDPRSYSVLAAVPDINRYPSVVAAIIRDTDRSLLISGNIQLYFLLGADDRLQKVLVRWWGTGP